MVDPKVVPRVLFNNGKSAPAIGLGTWQSPEGDETVYRAVKCAIQNGYRHIDCAWIYGNQKEIGRAIADCIADKVVTREELFVVSKIWNTYYSKERVPICVKQILADLKLDYVDLLLVHWPMSFEQQNERPFPAAADGKVIDGNVDYLEPYKALEELHDQGLAKSIGVSNFNVAQLERLLAVARIKPAVNQVECHPYLGQAELKQFCSQHNIAITAYSPLGNPGSSFNPNPDKEKLLKDPVVDALAEAYNKNPGQILIKFQLQRGNLVIPKSVKPDRIISNIQVFDFELTADEMEQLESLDCNYRTCAFLSGTHLKNYPF